MRKRFFFLLAAMILFVAAGTQRLYAQELIVHFYIPSQIEFIPSGGCAMHWAFGTEVDGVVSLAPESGLDNWYTATVPNSEYKETSITLLNAPSLSEATETLSYPGSFTTGEYYFVVNKDIKGDYVLTFADESWAIEGKDYFPYDLGISQREDTLFLSWKINEIVSACYVMVYDKAGNELLSQYIYDFENPYVLLSNAEEMEIRWAVFPSVHYTLSEALTAYSEPFKAAPSPKVATNLKAKENSDGTFTFSWDAPKSDKVKSYTLLIYDPLNLMILDEYNLKAPSITSKMDAMYSGSYLMKVYSNDQNWNTIGENAASFDVAEVAEHDINIRIMINPVSSYDTSSGVKFEIQGKSGSYATVDAVKEKYGWWSYKLTTKERGARIRLSGDYSTYEVFDDICLEFTGDLWLAECDARVNDYQPHDIAMVANEDGSYTISWLMDATDRVGYYLTRLYDPKSKEILYEQTNAMQVTTPVLSDPGFYNFYLDVYELRPMEYGGSYTLRIGSEVKPFEVKAQTARDIKLRVLVQPGNLMWAAATFNELDNDYTNPVAFAQEGSTAWYSYTFKDVTKPAVNVNFTHESDYSGTLFAVNEDMCIEFDNSQFTKVACDKATQDFTLSNLKREDKGNGKMTFSWDCASDPSTFGLYIADSKDNVLKYEEVVGTSRKADLTLAVDSAMAVVKWFVIPFKSIGMGDKKADGETFSLPASPFVPQNIKATMGADHKWNFTWDAISGVSTYKVELSDWGYGYYAYEPKYNAGYLAIGSHSVTITAMSQNYEELGSKSLKFMVSELPERDVKVRLLLHKDADVSTADDLMYEKSSGNYEYVSATDEGGRWFAYSFKTTVPAPRISLLGYSFQIGTDTCFEYITYLSEVACDAKAHDYRINDASLKATSIPGRVTFSWEAEEIADRYYVELQKWDEEGGYWRYAGSVNADNVTECTYMVPDNQDGLEVQWTVRPQSPHHLNEVVAKDKVTLQKSKIVISDLKAESSNNVDYHFSWKESTKADNIYFEVEIIASGTGTCVYSKRTPNTFCDYTFLSGAEHYSWRVRAVDNITFEPLTTWTSATESFEVLSSLRIINNLKGTVSGRTITFSWDKIDMPVVARMGVISKDKGMMLILDDKILTTNSYSFEAVEDGRYEFEINPVIEVISETSFMFINEGAKAAVNIFKNKTYKVEISATTGGFFDTDLSGEYEEGFELDLRVWPEKGYRFISWSDGYEFRMRAYEVKEDVKLVALFEPIPMYKVSIIATDGGEIRDFYNDKIMARLDTTLEEGDGVYIAAIAKEGHTFVGWSDGYSKDDLSRYISISQDTVVTATFKPICYASITAGVGGRVQVAGAKEYDKESKKYACVYGSELIIKAVPDEDYRFVEWSDGNKSVSRTISVIADVNLSAKFEAISDPISQYVVRILTNNTELGSVSQLSGTYYAGDKLTISAEPKECANFIKWSDGSDKVTRTITISSDVTLTALFELKHPVLTLSAGDGGSVNSEINGKYDYGTYVTIVATPDEHYQFVQWSDGETSMNRYIELTEDLTLTAQFAKAQYLITFLNEDGALLESKKYTFGEIPVCSVEPTLTIPGYVCVFKEWSPAITTVSANAVYTAVYDKTPSEPSAIEQVINSEENASKVLINGQIFILRGDRIYTVQGMLVK